MDPVVKPVVNPNTTYSGSSDTTRYPGFRSGANELGAAPIPAVPTPTVSTPAPAAPAPAPVPPAAPYIAPAPAAPIVPAEPTLTPGMLAAQNASPNRKTAIGSVLGSITGGLSRNNASPIQDIAGALALGRPISDKSWLKAGFGPGGTSLSTINRPIYADYSTQE